MSVLAQEDRPETLFFSGTSFAVGEIELSLADLGGHLAGLKAGNRAGSAVQQKLSSEAMAKTAGQIKALAEMLARVSINHLNRKPRIAQ